MKIFRIYISVSIISVIGYFEYQKCLVKKIDLSRYGELKRLSVLQIKLIYKNIFEYF